MLVRDSFAVSGQSQGENCTGDNAQGFRRCDVTKLADGNLQAGHVRAGYLITAAGGRAGKLWTGTAGADSKAQAGCVRGDEKRLGCSVDAGNPMVPGEGSAASVKVVRLGRAWHRFSVEWADASGQRGLGGTLTTPS